MRVRDAVEADADAMATLADRPVEVMRNLVHDRTVRVAVDGSEESVPQEGTPTETESEFSGIRGIVSFDARQKTVHITQLAGDGEAVERLLEEPIRFARREGMDVEAIVAAADEQGKAAVETKGFSRAGDGPRFDGKPTVRYRLEQ
ncbi:Uncharacterized protein AArcCO_3071 [Halalkaliarchaeum sp. AArc-CO]|uniref:hypothetical protein n=1 Tax=unclassified Halalkaliarchaeum TaxID=2678344 RepID=UPI00217E2E86|nr:MULTISPECIES: hypothetical protein [unclassified Halalkaliarchaeum]MDR5672764.1 hypothetical protein [Halalkaliarchaeum sp. AArc-GB]UWG52339.1 Uncharacterized protein AArcCO_3071 [Halalkaliarchaeum sp. AArc-CO]